MVRSIYIPVGTGAYTGFFGARKLLLGNRDDLDRSLELWRVHSLFERLPRLINGALLTVLAFFLLALFFTQKGHIEYLWLALYELLQAPIGLVELAGSSAQLQTFGTSPSSSSCWRCRLTSTSNSSSPSWRCPGAGISRCSATPPPFSPELAPRCSCRTQQCAGVALAVVYLGSTLWILGWLLFILIILITATLRRNFEAGLLLIPLLLSLRRHHRTCAYRRNERLGRPRLPNPRSPSRPDPSPSTLPPSPISPASWSSSSSSSSASCASSATRSAPPASWPPPAACRN